MAESINFLKVAETLARVEKNYANMVQSWFDVFYSDEDTVVNVDFYDENGNQKVYQVPTRAADRNFFKRGEGSPIDNSVAGKYGAMYQDTLNGDVYVKEAGSNSWQLLISMNTLNGYIRYGADNPEGREVGTLGNLYIVNRAVDEDGNPIEDDDITNVVHEAKLYMKTTSSGNTGWRRIDSFPTSIITEKFVIKRASTSTIKLNGLCDNKSLMAIYENGALLSPDLYDMPTGDRRTIQFNTPITKVSTEEDVEVIVKYFVDVHVVESEMWQNFEEYVRQCELLTYGASQEASSGYDFEAWSEAYQEFVNSYAEDGQLKSTKWYYDQSKNVYENWWDAFNSARAQLLQIAQNTQDLYDLFNEEYNALLDDTKDWVATKQEEVNASVATVSNYAVQVAQQARACEQWYENCKVVELNVQKINDYIIENYSDLATKNDVATAKNEIWRELYGVDESEFYGYAEIGGLKTYLTNYTDGSVYNLNSVISSTIESLNSDLSNQIVTISSNLSSVKDSLSNQLNTLISWVNSHSDLNDFDNETGYIRRDNFPIDVNGVYRYNSDLTNSSDNIVVAVNKDCTYYSVDIGEYMDAVREDTNFTFTIDPDDSAAYYNTNTLVADTITRVKINPRNNKVTFVSGSPISGLENGDILLIENYERIVPTEEENTSKKLTVAGVSSSKGQTEILIEEDIDPNTINSSLIIYEEINLGSDYREISTTSSGTTYIPTTYGDVERIVINGNNITFVFSGDKAYEVNNKFVTGSKFITYGSSLREIIPSAPNGRALVSIIGITNYDSSIEVHIRASISGLTNAPSNIATPVNVNVYKTLRYDSVVSQIRVFIKNHSNYRPTITWDESKIKWLGSELELEVGKDYILEFISDDAMMTWKAHALGICQPAIEVDKFDFNLDISCNAISGDPTLSSQPVAVVANVSGYSAPITLGDGYSQIFDGSTLRARLELERKYIGRTVSNVGIRTSGMRKFARYFSEDTFTVMEDVTNTLNCSVYRIDEYTYTVNLVSSAIEDYLSMNELDEVNVQFKFAFDSGFSKNEVLTGVYYAGDGLSFTFNTTDNATFDIFTDPVIDVGGSENYLRRVIIQVNETDFNYTALSDKIIQCVELNSGVSLVVDNQVDNDIFSIETWYEEQ